MTDTKQDDGAGLSGSGVQRGVGRPVPERTDMQAHGAPLWVNVRALAQALDDPSRHTPMAYLEPQASDDVCILLAADKATADGQVIKRLQDTLKARNEEIRTLRQLYCAVSAASEMLERHEPPGGVAPTQWHGAWADTALAATQMPLTAPTEWGNG